MSTASTSHRAGPHEVAELMSWCRRLSVARPDADPTERAAYLAAKTDLLTRITDPHTNRHNHHHGDHPEEQR